MRRMGSLLAQHAVHRVGVGQKVGGQAAQVKVPLAICCARASGMGGVVRGATRISSGVAWGGGRSGGGHGAQEIAQRGQRFVGGLGHLVVAARAR
jgi:hypothetical protein